MTEQAIAVVTGASKGIGRAIVLRLAKADFTVVASARTESDLKQLEKDVREAGGEARTVVADAMERKGAKAPVEYAIDSFGRVDVLVNNVAGTFGPRGKFFETTDDDFDATVSFTLMSPWWSTSAVLPTMRSQKSGRIINIGSGASNFGSGSIGYSAAKHGIAGMTKALAIAAAVHGITVNCVCPGYTNTPRMQAGFIESAEAYGITEEEAKEQARNQNAQHRVLEPAEVAGTVAFLASSEAAGITGQVISVDGGYRI